MRLRRSWTARRRALTTRPSIRCSWARCTLRRHALRSQRCARLWDRSRSGWRSRSCRCDRRSGCCSRSSRTRRRRRWCRRRRLNRGSRCRHDWRSGRRSSGSWWSSRRSNCNRSSRSWYRRLWSRCHRRGRRDWRSSSWRDRSRSSGRWRDWRSSRTHPGSSCRSVLRLLIRLNFRFSGGFFVRDAVKVLANLLGHVHRDRARVRFLFLNAVPGQ